jgi:hypothetical protein
MSRLSTWCRDKLIYYASIKQRERKLFRQIILGDQRFKRVISASLRAYATSHPAVKSMSAPDKSYFCGAKVQLFLDIANFFAIILYQRPVLPFCRKNSWQNDFFAFPLQ